MDLLEDIFGIKVKNDIWLGRDLLPLYISGSYEFNIVILNDIRCIMLTPTQELATLPALKKQIKRIQEVEDVPVVLRLSGISTYREKSVIDNRIPFITDKQIYLPFMGAYLQKEKTLTAEVKKFMYSTQLLALLYLYGKEDKLYLSEATKKLPFTAMSLSRAFKQLEATNLFQVDKDGVNKVIQAKYSRRDLYAKMLQYMQSPVRKKGYIEKKNLTQDMVLAGENVLAEKTMLNPPRISTYAINAKKVDSKIMMNELINPDKQVCLELWEYDPNQFSNTNEADILSVALSFIDCEDERILECIEELLESVW